MSELPAGDLVAAESAGGLAVRGVLTRIGGYVLGAFFGLASSALLFRHLGPEDAGRFVAIQSLALLAGGLADAGLTVIGVREYATRSGEDRQTMMRDLLGLRVVLTGLGAAGAVLFAVLAGYAPSLVAGTAIMGFAVLLAALQHALGIPLTAELRQGWITAVDVGRQAVNALAVVLLVVLGAALLPFFWAQVASSAVALGALVRVVRGTVPLRPSFARRRWALLLRDTLPVALAAAVAVIYYRLAVILMSLTASPTETGYFSAGFRGVDVLIAIPALAGGVVFPIFARAAVEDRERLAQVLGRVLDTTLTAGLAVALLLGVGAPVVIDVVAGREFTGAYDVLRIQGLGLLFSFLGVGVGFTLLAIRANRAIVVANLVALAAAAVLVPLLSSGGGGAVGAAVATTLAEGILFTGMAVSVWRAGVPLRLDRPLAVRTLICTLVGLAPALTGLPILARTALCGLAFAAAVLLLRALPPELRAHLPRPLR